jgi:type II secretory pathway pseudopilin PulG
MKFGHRQSGLTVVEVLVSVAVGAILILSLSSAVGQGLDAQNQTRGRAELLQDARFAMDRMLNALGGTRRLMLPLADNPATGWREHVREQTIPASPPEIDSTFATAVLAVTLPASQDLDADGWADANNDRDFQDLNGNSVWDEGEPERIDEDPGGDLSWDLASGIINIDDDGDGQVDEPHSGLGPAGEDDDEDGTANEDAWNILDDDGDGMIDEDPKKDMSGDGLAGVGGFDDDGDGNVDEGDRNDDDEDGVKEEDWLDPLVFFLQGTDLIERRPLTYDVNGDFAVNGLDFVESIIAEDVTGFRVERVPGSVGGVLSVDITLELTNAGGDRVSLHSVARVGGKA